MATRAWAEAWVAALLCQTYRLSTVMDLGAGHRCSTKTLSHRRRQRPSSRLLAALACQVWQQQLGLASRPPRTYRRQLARQRGACRRRTSLLARRRWRRGKAQLATRVSIRTSRREHLRPTLKRLRQHPHLRRPQKMRTPSRRLWPTSGCDPTPRVPTQPRALCHRLLLLRAPSSAKVDPHRGSSNVLPPLRTGRHPLHQLQPSCKRQPALLHRCPWRKC